MKKIILIIALSLMFNPLWAQNTTVDRLVQIALADAGKDNYPLIRNKDSLFRLLPQTREPGAKIDLIYQIINYAHATSLSRMSYHYKILHWAQKNNDTVAEVVVTAEIGPIMAENGDLVNGVKTCFKALKLAEKTGNKRLIGISYQNLAICYEGNNTGLLKFYIEKALKYSREGGEILLVEYELSDLATIYTQLNQPDSAKYYGLKTLEWAVKHRVNFSIVSALTHYGQLQNENVCLKYFRLAEKIALRQNDKFNSSVNAFFAIGQYYQKHNNLDSALFYARKAYNATRTAVLTAKIRAALLLSNCFKKNNADSILKYRIEYDDIKDSLYNISKFERAQSLAFEDEQNRHEMEAQNAAYQANLRMYILGVVVAFLFLLAFVFWRNNRKSKLANRLLQQQKEQVQQTLHELKTTQAQLVQREKMASLGELTAGIAHEIQNPLNFVNNFSEVNREMLEELKAESTKPKAERNGQLEIELINDLINNEEKINHHGKRADFIVKGMLQHSRTSTGEKQETNINVLADEFFKLSYHGLRAKDKNFNAELITNFDEALPKVNIAQQDIGRVLLNLFNNAFYAVNEKQKTAGSDYKPQVTVTTSAEKNNLIIKVKDNGNGIPDSIKDKIMQPFFTTKPTGEGTGLGLSLSYDIVVKGHGGSITMETKENVCTEFKIALPVSR